MENKQIGIRIKKLREELKLTQNELASKLGLNSETAIANYEAGYSIPKDEIKIKMCKLFNCTLDYLMCNSDIRNSKQEDSINEELIRIGFSMENYTPPTEKQKEQIKALLEVILKDNKKDEEKKDI